VTYRSRCSLTWLAFPLVLVLIGLDLVVAMMLDESSG
jgi:hypothetical protein